jgi:arylsulfatase A-like enzyme
VNTAALNWLSNRRKAPYFVFINYYDAHSPYLPDEPFDTSFDPRRPSRSKAYQTGVLWDGTAEETRLEKNNYDESIRWVDYEFGQLLEQLRLQGLLENTLVIVTSDHGEEFQEHQVMGHGDSLYRQSVQVPLLMIFPNHLPAGIRVDQPVSLRNIPATILDLAGLPDSSPFPGDTLTYYLDPSGFPPEQRHEYLLSEVSAGQWRPGFYPSSRGSLKSIEFDGLRYIRSGDGSEELYDFAHDPQELNDLSATPAGQAALSEYRTMLENILSSSNAK